MLGTADRFELLHQEQVYGKGVKQFETKSRELQHPQRRQHKRLFQRVHQLNQGHCRSMLVPELSTMKMKLLIAGRSTTAATPGTN